MEQKKETIADIIIRGEDAAYLRDLFGRQIDEGYLFSSIDQVFKDALWGKSSRGSEGDADDFRSYHYHYSNIVDMKRAASILFKVLAANS